MYNGVVPVAGGGAAGGALAVTGFPVLLWALVSVALIALGLVLLRVRVTRGE
jgi:hypothetical protein